MKLMLNLKKPAARFAPAPVPAPAPQKPLAPILPNAKKGNLDELAAFDIGNSRNCLVPWYLMASYLYYNRDVSLLSDEYYDRICHELLEHFPTIKHWHKHYIDKEQLKAGTGFRLRYDKFHVRIISAANTLAHEALGVPYPGK